MWAETRETPDTQRRDKMHTYEYRGHTIEEQRGREPSFLTDLFDETGKYRYLFSTLERAQEAIDEIENAK